MAVKSARDALTAHLALIGKDAASWLELFADDAIMEFPYASSLGYPRKLEGKAAIASYMREVFAYVGQFRFSDVRVFPTEDPNVIVAEFNGDASVTSTGRDYKQEYIVRLETKNGKIIYYREYWDPIAVLRAFDGQKLHLTA
jgi:ketosteroid isomerase-like protein